MNLYSLGVQTLVKLTVKLIAWSPMFGRCGLQSFIWSHLSAPVELFTRYTTADIVLERCSECYHKISTI